MALGDFAAERRRPAPWIVGLAEVGAHLSGKEDPPPGHQALWTNCTGPAVLAQGGRKADPHGPGEWTVTAALSRRTSRVSDSARHHRIRPVDAMERLQNMRHGHGHPNNVKPMPVPP